MPCLGNHQFFWYGQEGTLRNEDEMVRLAQTLKTFTRKAKESALYSEGF